MEIKIPIEIVELEDNSFHIIVSLQIGSIEGDFIIDTGASVTVIDKLTPFSYEPLDDVSEINSGGVCGDKHLQRRGAGLLGSDFLVRHEAIIDYGNKELTLKVSA